MSLRISVRFVALVFLLVMAGSVLASPSAAQQIVQSQGLDSRVDYETLKRFGPWDDRNYRLTAEDLEILPEDDTLQNVAVPAFFRVQVRKRVAELGREFQRYPRSTLPRFMNRYGGYLIDRRLYRKALRDRDGFHVVVDTEEGTEPFEFLVARAGISETRVTSPNDAAESAVAIKPTDTDIVIAGTNGPGPGQVMHYSTDGGDTWSSAGLLSGSCCDPTVGWSTDGAVAYTATLGDDAVEFYTSSDGGQSWGNKRSIDSGFVDKEYLHVDVSPTSGYKDNVYLTWHLNNEMRFARSTSRGATWSAVTGFDQAPLGIGSDITSDKAGNVYYIYPAFGGRIILLESNDGGATFEPHEQIATTQGDYDFPLPAMESRRAFIYVSADVDLSSGPYSDSLYASWTDSTAATGETPSDNHGRITVAYSRDGGDTWSFSTPHSTTDQNSVDRFHQWLKVGPDGSVHIVFYDTGADNDRTTVDFYYSVSTDGAQTWSTPERLTTVSSKNIGDGFEWGDYNGLDVVLNDLIGIYTDNRNESGGSGDSVDVYSVRKSVSGATTVFEDGFESGNTSRWSG